MSDDVAHLQVRLDLDIDLILGEVDESDLLRGT